MLLDFAAKKNKAKCKIKHQMESVLIIRGYKVLVEMIENTSQYRVSINCGVSFNLLIWYTSIEETLRRGTNDSIFIN